MPPKELELGKGERGIFVAVPRNFDTSHVNPGDKVSFRVSTLAAPTPTAAPKPAAAAATGAASSGVGDLPAKPEEAGDAAPDRDFA